MEQTDTEKTEAALQQHKDKLQRIVQKLGLYVMKQRAQHKQEPDQITQHIFLGSYSAACNKESLHGHNIKHVLMCLGHMPEPHAGEFNYMQIRIKDSEDEEIRQHFDSTYEFIENAIVKEERILVHCFAGISRSTTILAAYLMRKSGEPLDKVLQLIQKRRSIVRPNMGFMDQLRQFEKSLFSQADQNKVPQPTEPVEQVAQGKAEQHVTAEEEVVPKEPEIQKEVGNQQEPAEQPPAVEQPSQTAQLGEQVPESEQEKLPAVESVPEEQKVEESRPETTQTEAYKVEASKQVEEAQPEPQDSPTEKRPEERKQQEPKPEEPTSTEAPKEAQKPVQEAPPEAQKSVAQTTTETTEPDAQQGEPTEKEPQQESKTEGKKKKNKNKKKK